MPHLSLLGHRDGDGAWRPSCALHNRSVNVNMWCGESSSPCVARTPLRSTLPLIDAIKAAHCVVPSNRGTPHIVGCNPAIGSQWGCPPLHWVTARNRMTVVVLAPWFTFSRPRNLRQVERQTLCSDWGRDRRWRHRAARRERLEG